VRFFITRLGNWWEEDCPDGRLLRRKQSKTMEVSNEIFSMTDFCSELEQIVYFFVLILFSKRQDKRAIVTLHTIRILKISHSILIVLSNSHESDIQLENSNSGLYYTEGRAMPL